MYLIKISLIQIVYGYSYQLSYPEPCTVLLKSEVSLLNWSLAIPKGVSVGLPLDQSRGKAQRYLILELEMKFKKTKSHFKLIV